MTKSTTPSILYLNRCHGDDIELEFLPVKLNAKYRNQRDGNINVNHYKSSNTSRICKYTN